MTYKSEFLNILEQRGFFHQCSDFEGLDAKLQSGVQSAYIGYDPTGTSLHVGHLYTIMLLHWFQKCGHKPITLMGGGTALVGDPSFKDKSRPLLGEKEINENIETIQTVFSKFLTYGDGETDAMMVNNADWLKALNYMAFLRDYGTYFTVNRMMSFESVKLRLEREQPLTFLEFNYMILQAYDFLELYRRQGTVLQMGGSDQWGNMINGLELGRKAEQAELFVLTAPLLTTASGQKMGKTEGGAVWLNADLFSAYDYYQYWRNVEDADVVHLLKIFTFLPMNEIAKLEQLRGQEINEAKKVLAYEATKILHGEKAAHEAQETAQQVFEEGGVGKDLPMIEIAEDRLVEGVALIDLFIETGLVSSKGEARRLIQGGGAKLNDNAIEDAALNLTAAYLDDNNCAKLSAGKKKHALVKVA